LSIQAASGVASRRAINSNHNSDYGFSNAPIWRRVATAPSVTTPRRSYQKYLGWYDGNPAHLEGDGAKLLELLSLFDTFSPMFEIVEPKQRRP
jgi:alkyl sulfatase-like protein